MANRRSTSRRSCVFCGSSESKITREHLWPDWLRGLVDTSSAERRDFRYDSQDTYSDRAYSVDGQSLFSRTVSGVCASCNGGWMNDLETETKRIASGVLVGEPAVLGEAEQVTIAMWGALKSYVGQIGFRGSPAVPDAHRRELMRWCRKGQPPPETSVYAGQTRWSAGGSRLGFFRLNEIDRRVEGSSRLGYLMTFTALDLLVATVRSRDTDERWDFEFPAAVASSLTQIWPPRAELVWPHGRSLDDAGVLLAAGGLRAVD